MSSSETEPVIVASYCPECDREGGHVGSPCDSDIWNDEAKGYHTCPGTLAPAVSLAAWRQMREQRDAALVAAKNISDLCAQLNGGMADARQRGANDESAIRRLQSELDAALARVNELESDALEMHARMCESDD